MTASTFSPALRMDSVGSVLFVAGAQSEAVKKLVADARDIINQHGGDV